MREEDEITSIYLEHQGASVAKVPSALIFLPSLMCRLTGMLSTDLKAHPAFHRIPHHCFLLLELQIRPEDKQSQHDGRTA